MWVVTKIGFFSAVQKYNTNYLTIRARVRKDLENLIPYLPGEGYQIETSVGHDYPYRMLCWHDAWAEGMAKLSQEIDYDNFKSAIGDKDPARETILHRVWSALFGLEELEKPPKTQGKGTGAEGYGYAWKGLDYQSLYPLSSNEQWIGYPDKERDGSRKGNKK